MAASSRLNSAQAAVLIAAAIGFLAISGYWVLSVTSETIVARQAERASMAWSRYIAQELDRIEEIAAGAPLTRDEQYFLEGVRLFGSVFRFKLFDPQGRMRLVSDDLNTAQANAPSLKDHNPKAASVLATGKPHTTIHENTGKPDRPPVYIETYVPVLRDGRTVAIVEVYLDYTADVAHVRDQFTMFGLKVAGLTLLAMSIPGMLVLWMIRALGERNRALDVERRRALLADRSKSEFLANMSHEIRTPMNAVIGMTEVLAGTDLTDRQRSFVEVIQDSGRNLLALINDILDFSKIDAGQLELDCRPFDFRAAAEDIVALVAPRGAEKDMEIAIRFQPSLPTNVIGDSRRIRQVLLNLIGNAVKFTDRGHVLIEVTGTTQGDSVELAVRVEDTGIGIAPDKIDAVFDKFTQVDGSSTRRYEGTGLGLTISKSLIELMGGRIGVESIPGQGSTFWFTLTLPIHEGAGAKKQAPIDISDARVLVVDDNEVNRKILVEQFGSWRFRVSAVPSGKEALLALRQATAEKDPFELVVLDYHMPGMDGEETAREIRGQEAGGDTPIILMTSVDGWQDARHFQELGVQEYLVKPASSSLLFDASVKLVTGARGQRKAPETQRVRSPERTSRDDSAGHSPAVAGSSGVAVLIVEDNEMNRAVMEALLEGCGHSHRTAADGREALDVLKTFRPDVILMDVAMPVMSGIEATRDIRKAEAETGRHVPIIGVTAHALTGDREECLAAGMDDYLAKPVSKDALARKIAQWARKGGRDRTVA